jgi:hypothetical protein
VNSGSTNTLLLNKAAEFHNIMSTFGLEFLKNIISSRLPRKHPLCVALETSLYRKNDAWLSYLDHCLQVAMPMLETVVNKKTETLGELGDADKFHEAFVEIEWIAKLADKKFEMKITPLHPEIGPDLKVKADDTEIYIEIESLNLSGLEQKRENMWTELETRIGNTKSRRYVSITTNADFCEKDVSPLVHAVQNKISELERKDDHSPTTLYYFSENDIREWYGFDGLTYPSDVQTDWRKYPLYTEQARAKSKVTILFISESMLRTTVGTGGTDFSNLQGRIKEAVLGKIRQLKPCPADAPKIVVLDLSRTSADQTVIGWGIYGQDAYRLLVDTRTGRTISERGVRLDNGAFSITETISAVIIPRRIENATGVHLTGDVLLNPKAGRPIPPELLQQITML